MPRGIPCGFAIDSDEIRDGYHHLFIGVRTSSALAVIIVYDMPLSSVRCGSRVRCHSTIETVSSNGEAMMNFPCNSTPWKKPVILGALCLLTGVGISIAGPAQESLAQHLVTTTMSAHPELTEIGISVHSTHGCHSIASTDAGDVGERCETGDLRVMRTSRPYAVKENDGFDVSVPLHDVSGKLIGSLAIEFRLQSGETNRSVIAEASKIAREMEAQIPSKASLYERK